MSNETTHAPGLGEWHAAGIDGAALRAARERAGLSQTALAARLHTTQVTVSAWERDIHVPQAVYRAKLVEALGLDLDEGAGAFDDGPEDTDLDI